MANKALHRVVRFSVLLSFGAVCYWAGQRSTLSRCGEGIPESNAFEPSPDSALLEAASRDGTALEAPTAMRRNVEVPITTPSQAAPSSKEAASDAGSALLPRAGAFGTIEQCLASSSLNPTGKIVEGKELAQLKSLIDQLNSEDFSRDAAAEAQMKSLVQIKVASGDVVSVNEGDIVKADEGALRTSIRFGPDGKQYKVVLHAGEYAPLDDALAQRQQLHSQGSVQIKELILSF